MRGSIRGVEQKEGKRWGADVRRVREKVRERK